MPNSREVADYLEKHPDFFTQRRDLLAAMDLPEASGATPFHERQVRALRDRQARLDRMLDTVRDNQHLEQELHQVAVELLNRDGLDGSGAPAALVEARFGLDAVAIFLSSQIARQPASAAQVDYPSLCRRVEHLGSSCDDRVSSKLSASLFPDAGAIASCAFVPLARGQALCGVMVLGAADSQRFQPGMGVLILDRLGQLISAYLAGRNLL
ncbi:MAG: DUF484 family protein [Gammaproteobacteria bacterium]|nr:DUF484 family protein [Gammaproteobacteria bacterium]